MYDYTGKTIFIGIDVHKDSYSISAICEGALVKRDKILADPKLLVKYCRSFKDAHIKSAYEAGFCGFHLHRFLIGNGIENIVVHPASIEVSSRDVVKTDKRDSLKIATQLAEGKLMCVFIPSEIREDKRNLTRLRKNFIKQRTRVACQIKSLLHLHGMIRPLSKPRISEKYLKNLLELKMPENLKFCVKTYAKTWRYFNQQIQVIGEEIASKVGFDARLEEIYCSAPGVGPTVARILINELEDTLQFANEDKLFSHVGLTPREHSSGGHTRRGHITRQGKPVLRNVLVEASWRAIKEDHTLASIFEKLKQRRGGTRAIVAIARILLGRIRSCIKEDRLYYIPEKTTMSKVA